MKCTGFMRFGVIKFNTESEKNTHIFIHTHSTQSERERRRQRMEYRERENKIRQCERKKMCDVCKAWNEFIEWSVVVLFYTGSVFLVCTSFYSFQLDYIFIFCDAVCVCVCSSLLCAFMFEIIFFSRCIHFIYTLSFLWSFLLHFCPISISSYAICCVSVYFYIINV